jgi:DNA end-binding protein Ku
LCRGERRPLVRAIWKGAVSFGLVSVPVKLYAATESHDISFRQVHAKDGGRIKYQRICSIDGEEVAYADIAKGYETDDGQMVILDDDDLAELPVSSSREISVDKFVPSDQIDPMLFEKSYYLEPDKAAAKPYALLREALKEADRMAVVTVSLRTRMTTAILRVRGDVIVMQTMMWPDEIRSPEFAGLDGAESSAKPAELQMARLLVETLAGDFDPDEYEDDYREAVEAMVQAKLEGGEVKRPPEAAPSGGEVVDLLAALQRSVDAAKSARGEEPGPVEKPADEAPDEAAESEDEETSGAGAKKSAQKTAQKTAPKTAPKTAQKPGGQGAGGKAAAKKAPAKKAAAKKAPAKKAATRATAESRGAKTGAAKTGSSRTGTSKTGTAKTAKRTASRTAKRAS